MALGLVACFNALATAAPVRFVFEGRVTHVRDGLGALGAAAGSLSTFSGSVTFESTTPGVSLGSWGELYYPHTTSPAGVEVRIGDFTFRTDPAQRRVDFYVRDEYGLTGTDELQFGTTPLVSTGLAPGLEIDFTQIGWVASTSANLFDSPALPMTPPDLSSLGGGVFSIYGECGSCGGGLEGSFQIEGTLTRLTLPTSSASCDLDSNGRVDAADAALFAHEFGRSGASDGMLKADWNGDGAVGLADLMELQRHLSPPTAASTAAVPEPSGAVIGWMALVVALFATFAARRRLRLRPAEDEYFVCTSR